MCVFLPCFRVEFVLFIIHYKIIVNLKLMNRKNKIYLYIYLYVDLPCRISSEHNAATVAKIEEAIGTTNFAPALILSMDYCVCM